MRQHCDREVVLSLNCHYIWEFLLASKLLQRNCNIRMSRTDVTKSNSDLYIFFQNPTPMYEKNVLLTVPLYSRSRFSTSNNFIYFVWQLWWLHVIIANETGGKLAVYYDALYMYWCTYIFPINQLPICEYVNEIIPFKYEKISVNNIYHELQFLSPCKENYNLYSLSIHGNLCCLTYATK